MDVAGFFLTPGSTWVIFYMFANTLSHLWLVCSFTMLLNSLCMVSFTHVGYFFFVTPKTCFVQLQVCISLRDRG